MGLLNANGMLGAVGEPKRLVTMPSEIATLPYDIYYNNGLVTTDFDFEAVKPSVANTYYVDLDNGSNSNSGLDWDNALKTPNAAKAKSGSKAIYIAGASIDYDRNHIMTGNINSDVQIYGVDRGLGLPEMWAAFESQTWAADGNTWKANRSAMNNGRVIDKSNITQLERGSIYTDTIEQDTLADLKALTEQELLDIGGAWYSDNSSVWVRTFDSRDISVDDSDIKLCFNFNGVENNGDHTTYIEDAAFYGGVRAFRVANNASSGERPKLYARRSKFNYCMNDNGLDTNGADGYLEEVEALSNHRDGINHSERLGYIGLFTQVKCNTTFNGRTGSFNNNGSTIHDGGTLIIIDEVSNNNEGPNVHAVDDGTKLFILSSTSTNSRATNENSKVCYGIGAGNEAGEGVKAWIYFSHPLEGTQTWDARVYAGNTLFTNQSFGSVLNDGTINPAPQLW